MSLTTGKLGDTQVVYSINSIAEKENLNTEELFCAIEHELAEEIGKKKYGSTMISGNINRETGEITVSKRYLVVPDNEFEERYENFLKKIEEEKREKIIFTSRNKYDDLIRFSDALEKDPKIENEKIISEQLPGANGDYLMAKSMKPRLERVVNALIRSKQYNDYKNRVGSIVVGVVKRIVSQGGARKSVAIDIGSGVEAFLPSSNTIRGEYFKVGERVKAIIEKVEFSLNKSQVICSRTSDQFLEELLVQQVPEVYDKIITLERLAREPGSRAKVAVHTTDSNIDPVGACIGMRGNRINAISEELGNERIDVIEYSNDPVRFLMNAIKPVKAAKVIIDDHQNKMDLIIPDEKLSLIIGRMGQNIQLISKLIDWKIKVSGESEISKKKMEDFTSCTKDFTEALNVEEVIAQLLVTEGFTKVTEIANSEVEKIANIEGFDEEIAIELNQRAKNYIEENAKKDILLLEKYSVNDEFLKSLPQNKDVVEKILEANLKNLEDIADLSIDDLLSITGDDLGAKDAEILIMNARRKMGWL